MSAFEGVDVVEQGAGVLPEAAREIRTAQEELTAIAVRLRSQIEPTAAGWRGAGGSAFASFHEAWHAKEQRIVDILTHFSEAIGATHASTTQVDADQSAIYHRTAGRLG